MTGSPRARPWRPDRATGASRKTKWPFGLGSTSNQQLPMKKCANCGFENSDESLSCPMCSTDTFISTTPQSSGGHIISPEEQRFWEKMTFRQFAVFYIRIQALWLLFYAVIDATYLQTYYHKLQTTYYGAGVPSARFEFIFLVLRVAMHVGLAILCIRYADRIVSWMVKDVVPKLPPAEAPKEQTNS
jgi:hypothetical protein